MAFSCARVYRFFFTSTVPLVWVIVVMISWLGRLIVRQIGSFVSSSQGIKTLPAGGSDLKTKGPAKATAATDSVRMPFNNITRVK